MRNLLALFLLAFLVFVALELALHVNLPFLSGQEDWGCPAYPTTTKAVAGEVGGAPENWYKSGQRSWTYNGSTRISFRVPDGCVLALSTGNKQAGEKVTLTGGETITWPDTS